MWNWIKAVVGAAYDVCRRSWDGAMGQLRAEKQLANSPNTKAVWFTQQSPIRCPPSDGFILFPRPIRQSEADRMRKEWAELGLAGFLEKYPEGRYVATNIGGNKNQ